MDGSFTTAGSKVMVVAPTGLKLDATPPNWVTSKDPADPLCSGVLLLLLLLLALGTTMVERVGWPPKSLLVWYYCLAITLLTIIVRK